MSQNLKRNLDLNAMQAKIYDETSDWIKNLPSAFHDLVKQYDYAHLGKKTIVCTAVMHSGYEITSYSSPVHLEAFNVELGKVLAKRKVLEEMLALERYAEFSSTLGTTVHGSCECTEVCDECKCENVEQDKRISTDITIEDGVI